MQTARPANRWYLGSARLHNFIFVVSGLTLIVIAAIRKFALNESVIASSQSSSSSTLSVETPSVVETVINNARTSNPLWKLLHQHRLEHLIEGDGDYVELSDVLLGSKSAAVAHPGWDAKHFYMHPWELVNTRDKVQTFSKTVPGSKLLAFRGISLMDVHISDTMGPFAFIKQSLEWIPILQHIELLPVESTTTIPLADISWEEDADVGTGRRVLVATDLVYQVLSLPWPISPRDILLLRHATFDERMRQITLRYVSVDDARRPEGSLHTDGRRLIRALSPHTLWRFTAIPSSSNNNNNHTTTNSSSTTNSSTSSNGFSSSAGGVQVFRGGLQQSIRRLWQNVSQFSQRIWKFLQHRAPTSDKKKSSTSTSSNDRSRHKDSSKSGSVAKVAVCNRSMHQHQQVLVEVETVVDSRGSIPTWFVNFMQRHWPAQTLSTFRSLVKQGKMPVYDAVNCW